MTIPRIPFAAPHGVTVRELPLRAVALVGLVVLAYNYSLLTLARGLTLQTPLAYLALVPLMALGLAAVRLRIQPPALPIHDRQLDWIVGLGLLGITAAILLVVPTSTSSSFWLQRVDLLTLPLFVSGLIALLFGVRRIWALKGPIAFLLLAWPIPFTVFLSGTLDQFTEVTARVVGWIVQLVPVAHPSVADDTMFIIGSGRQAFAISIGSACAGVNSFVGFLLIGLAFLYAVRGPIGRRMLWLALGLFIVFGLNVVRIVAILATGATLGEQASLDVLHPVAGLITFNLGVLLMVALAPRFGLRFIGDATPPAEGGAPPNPVRRVRPALVVAAGVTVVLAVANLGFSRYEAITNGLADARLTSFDVRTAHVPNWRISLVGNFIQGQQYFGAASTWQRVLYTPTPAATIQSSRNVYLDAITTEDQGTFAAYGLEACYQFHGYQIASIVTTDIGAGVQAQVIDYINPKTNVGWSALWWEWPYTDAGKTRFERIVVFMANGPDATFKGVPDMTLPTQSAQFVETDKFLTTLGRTIVRSQLATAAAQP
jgi:exosortase